MVFSSVVFLMFFLPTLLVIYFIFPQKYVGLHNLILLGFSILFYAWGGLRYLWLLLLSVAINYTCGLFVGEGHSRLIRKIALIVAVVANLSLLGWFKYAGFFAQTLQSVGVPLSVPQIVLPIGISFFTFQGMSYVIDVSRSDAKVQKNPLSVALYVILFPQLVAGPIVRYTTVEKEICNRRTSFSDFSEGVSRFLVGLGKKMLLANTMAEVADAVFALPTDTLSVSLAWIGAIAYTFQIYFDFSAYSDMAIGLGRIFGFHFLENFNYPYIAKTVTEFWRRWHISLSSWFRDYVYIPLGGSKEGKRKHIRNIIVVWLLTGFWHGAAWTFVAWGIWFCLLLLGEKFLWGRFLQKLPAWVGHGYTLFAVVISWVFFRSASIGNAFSYLGAMFGIGSSHMLWCEDSVYELLQYGVFFLLCAVGSLPLVSIWRSFCTKWEQKGGVSLLFRIWVPKFFVLGVMVLSYMKLATGSFNPFIYFQF